MTMPIYFLMILQKLFVLLGSLPGNAGQIMKALIEESEQLCHREMTNLPKFAENFDGKNIFVFSCFNLIVRFFKEIHICYDDKLSKVVEICHLSFSILPQG